MFLYLSDLTKGLLGLVYPSICEICSAKINTDTGQAYICPGCLKKIPLLAGSNPLRHKGINVWSVSAYDGVSKECIHLLKYSARLNLVEPLGRLMQNFTNNCLRPYKFDIIVPVPLHRNRLRERGFNQAELLAERLARFTARPIAQKAIIRIKPTLAQAGLSKTKRFINLRGAFRINDGPAVAGKNILLIDDVFTTGSTIAECAKALFKAKAKSVEALVLARGI